MVHCKDQAELDRMWDKLLAGGGKPQQCGWLKDRFGLSWQVVPENMGEIMRDPKKAAPVMRALLGMVKLDIATLERARFDGCVAQRPFTAGPLYETCRGRDRARGER